MYTQLFLVQIAFIFISYVLRNSFKPKSHGVNLSGYFLYMKEEKKSSKFNQPTDRIPIKLNKRTPPSLQF